MSKVLWWVCLDPSVFDHKTKEFPQTDNKSADSHIDLHLVMFENLESFTEIKYVVGTLFAIHQHVIYIDFYKRPKSPLWTYLILTSDK